MISSCLKFECTHNDAEYEALVLSLQRIINLNVAALTVILYPVDNVDAFKNITIDEGKHEQPLETTAGAKQGNLILEGWVSLNKLYGLHNFYQGTRNSGTHRTTTTNEQGK